MHHQCKFGENRTCSSENRKSSGRAKKDKKAQLLTHNSLISYCYFYVCHTLSMHILIVFATYSYDPLHVLCLPQFQRRKWYVLVSSFIFLRAVLLCNYFLTLTFVLQMLHPICTYIISSFLWTYILINFIY